MEVVLLGGGGESGGGWWRWVLLVVLGGLLRQFSISPAFGQCYGVSDLVSGRCMVARVERVGAPNVWLQPGTMVVPSLGQRSSAPRRHGARLGSAARAASGGPAFGRPLVDPVPSADVWPSAVSAGCGWLRRFVVLLRLGGARWWWCSAAVLL